MKKLVLGMALISLMLLTISAVWIPTERLDVKPGFVFGDPEIASINQMAFGSEGILFLGDSKKATVYALDLGQVENSPADEEIDISGFDAKLAASLGTTIENMEIRDMAVHPDSRTPYFAVQVTDGTPVLLRMKGTEFEPVDLKAIAFSKIGLKDPVDVDAKDRRERPLRTWAISDLKFHDGNVYVSGLSNKEFGSTFRSIPFPFEDDQQQATLEIWHAAHGQYETHAPIKAFDIIQLQGKDHLMASYTCTPLVLFPLEELKDGTHNKGRTVAELGAGNSPLDMISYQKKGDTYFLMSNTNRPVMRIKHSDIASFDQSLTEPVEVFAETEGVPYDNLPFPYVMQMDNLDENTVLYLQRTADGDLRLRTRSIEWM